jgi:hypothetical protein
VKDRRTAGRFPLNIPVIFRWRDRKGKRRWANGITRDVSSAGAFVMTTDCPPVGAKVQLDMLLPPLGRHDADMRVVGQGRVLRVEAGPVRAETLGFAAQNASLLLWEFEGFDRRDRGHAAR